MNVSVVPNSNEHPDFEEFAFAVEVRSSHGMLVQRWTYRSREHAERECRRIAELFSVPEVRGGRPIVC